MSREPSRSRRRITILQGHPDPNARHLGHALAEAYAKGTMEAGHEVRVLEIAQIDFPLPQSQSEFERGTPGAAT